MNHVKPIFLHALIIQLSPESDNRMGYLKADKLIRLSLCLSLYRLHDQYYVSILGLIESRVFIHLHVAYDVPIIIIAICILARYTYI